MTSTAMVELTKEGADELISEVAIGDGSVDAMFKAVERATGYSVKLQDYGIRSVTDNRNALGEATVKIESDMGAIVGKAIDEDVMQASINAFINAINKKIDQES